MLEFFAKYGCPSEGLNHHRIETWRKLGSIVTFLYHDENSCDLLTLTLLANLCDGPN